MISRLINLSKNVSLINKNKRFFDLHEYQSKEVMDSFGVRVQKGDVGTTAEKLRDVAKTLNDKGGLILKAQVHAGGRGKGVLSSGLVGGVKVLKTPQEVYDNAKQMIGYNLVTHQTKKEGLKVNACAVVEGVDIEKQFYLAFILDRKTQGPALIASVEGGVEIEKVAERTPEKILFYPFSHKTGLSDAQLSQLAKDLGLNHMAADVKQQVQNLYKLFKECDATQLEINPWSTDPDNDKVWCIDAKINIDDNAKFRQKKLTDMRENSLGSEEIDPHEEKALAAGLNYVALDGNIGCMVNGAGLAMATMDIIKLFGEEPANFLDVGGGASVDQCKAAFQILTSHPSVKCILVNIFGGILSCQTIADGICQAAQSVNVTVPLIVRLSGNSSEAGRKLLEEFAKSKGYNIQVASNMADAAKLAAESVKGK